jgi:hypothetical protein
MWFYNHYTAAHEETGQHAQTLDHDLRNFVSKILEKSEQASADIALFIVGDHGMRYGDFLSGTHAIQEHRLPVFFMISNRSFLE